MYIKKTKIMKFKYYLAFLLLSLCSIAVHAYDFEVDGIYYNVLDLTKRTVEVTHSGNRESTFSFYVYNYASYPVTCSLPRYKSNYGKSVVIPSEVEYKGRTFSVTRIAQYAFCGQKEITSISIPSSVAEIAECKSLTDVTSLLFPGNKGYPTLVPFTGCDNLTEIKVGNAKLLKVFDDRKYEAAKLYKQILNITLAKDIQNEISFDFSIFINLNQLVSQASTPPVISGSTFTDKQYMNLPVYVSEEALDAYQKDENWSKFWELRAIKEVNSLSLDQNNLDLGPNDTIQLVATIQPEDAFNQELHWTSSDSEVATVDENGKVISVGKGDAVITVATTDGSNLSATFAVHVDCLVNSIELHTKSLFLEPNQTAQLSATVLPNEAYVKDLTWKSLDESVASVDAQGLVKTNGAGKTKIIATTTDGSALSDTCEIVVVNLSSVKVGDLYYKVGTGGAAVIANPDGIAYQGTVVIPESITVEEVGIVPVTSIGDYAFEDATGLTKIALPTSIKSIGANAFSGCSSLEFVSIANGSQLTANLDIAFIGNKITELYLGADNVTFDKDSKLLVGLKSIVIGNAVSTLPDVAVCNNTLERFIIEDGTTAILEPENYYTMTYKQVYSQNVKDLGWKTSEGGYDMYFSFGYQVSVLHLKPLADLIENKTIKYIYFGREVDCPETEKPAYKIVPTEGGSYYKNRGYMDQYSYTYTDYIANRDYKENELTSIKLNQDKAALEVGEQLQLSVINEPSSVPSTNVIKWTSSNEEVAKVDMFGNVTIISNGEAIITAETLDGSKLSASCTILDKTTGVDDIIVDTESGYSVYNMSGICVLKTSNKSDLVRLPKGIYIVNNKKVVIQ